MPAAWLVGGLVDRSSDRTICFLSGDQGVLVAKGKTDVRRLLEMGMWTEPDRLRRKVRRMTESGSEIAPPTPELSCGFVRGCQVVRWRRLPCGCCLICRVGCPIVHVLASVR